MENLKIGTKLIRMLIVFAILISGTGVVLLNFPEHPHEIITLFFVLNVIALAAVLRILVVRDLPGRIKQVSSVIMKAADGELTGRVDFDGETEMSTLGENINTMLERLSAAMGKVHNSLFALISISATIKGLSEEGVSVAATQSEALKLTTSAIREINESIKDISQLVINLMSFSTDNSNLMGEMSSSLETTTQQLHSLVHSVEEVSTSIIQMASAIREIQGSTSVLQDDTATTSELVGNMGIAIKKIGMEATDTSLIAERVRNDAEEGRKTVDAAIAGMNEIKRSSSITFSAIESLSKRVSTIGTILSVIDEVAEQTNLLSLNASIIAAQAGDKGKSFQVVAGEIKQLAKRTGNHTREISEIILGIREETDRAVSAITLSEKKIEEGSELSHRSGEALGKIVSGIQEASARMKQINYTVASQADSGVAVQQAMGNVAELVTRIATATFDQGHDSKMIITEVGRMRDLTHEVMVAIDSHKRSAENVVKDSAAMNSLVAEICEASVQQSISAEQITGSLRNFEETTEMHVHSTMVIGEILHKLSRQIELLQGEVSRFRVADVPQQEETVPNQDCQVNG